MLKKRLFKILILSFIAIASLHLSGVESAFCDDGLPLLKTDSHGCMVCQPGYHSASAIQQSTLSSIPAFLGFAPLHYNVLKTQDPAFQLLRPPIFA